MDIETKVEEVKKVGFISEEDYDSLSQEIYDAVQVANQHGCSNKALFLENLHEELTKVKKGAIVPKPSKESAPSLLSLNSVLR